MTPTLTESKTTSGMAAPVNNAETVARSLQTTLVELIDLALVGKQAHWNLTGPFFAPVHEHLDGMVGQYQAWGDEVAERIRALGLPADGLARTVAESSPLAPFRADLVPDSEVLHWFADALRATAGRFREHIAAVSDHDPISEDILIGIVQGIEKQHWMIRSQIAS